MQKNEPVERRANDASTPGVWVVPYARRWGTPSSVWRRRRGKTPRADGRYAPGAANGSERPGLLTLI